MKLSTALIAAISATPILASSLTAPVLPLIVRNPYLSIWLGNARDKPWENWPIFWTGAPVGLAIMARVDGDGGESKGLVYPLLGKGDQNLKNVAYPTYLGASYDASTTNLTYNIDGGRGENSTIVLSFLSPITPASTFRQSLPAAYINVHVSGSLELSVYIDIDGRWATGEADPVIHWGFHQDDLPTNEGILPLKTFHFYNGAGEKLFTEQNDRAEWGQVFFTGPRGVEHCAGTDTEVRSRFASTGHAGGYESCKTVSAKNEVLAFSKTFQLGIGAKSDSMDDSVLFTIGHVQDPIVQFAAARGLTMMRPLWASWFEDAQSMVTYHYLDFQNAFALAANYSEQLQKDAKEERSDGYADILALSARQVMGATSFSGTPEDPLLFLKEISSNGDMQTVDVIFPAFPFFLYTNPRWLAYLLEPLIEHQLSGQYPNDYSLHDIGVFPNGTGHADGRDEYMPVEECGNMLIMSLALANSLKETKETGSPWAEMGQPDHDVFDGGSLFPLGLASKPDMDSAWVDAKSVEKAKKWLSRTHKLLKQWTGYLVRESLIPANQLSTDDFAGWLPNQTNLALKGIIGIRAMSDVSSILGFEEDAKKYRNISEMYADKWQKYAISRDGTHVKVAYTWYGSWATTYNLFADSLLCFHLDDSKTDGKTKDVKQKSLKNTRTSQANRKLIPDKVYDMQSTHYHNVMQRYGLPLDSRHLYTKSDWQLFAASVASTSVRDEIITAVARWVNETVSDGPFTDLYETEGKGEFGAGNRFRARPVVGGHFAEVSLARSCGGRVREEMKGGEPDGKGGQGTKKAKDKEDTKKEAKKDIKKEAQQGEILDPECHRELERLETQAMCLYDTNITKFDMGKYWRRIGGWTPNYDSFLAHNGKYYRPFAKGEAIGVVGARNDKGHMPISEPKKAQEEKKGEAKSATLKPELVLEKQDPKCRKRLKFLQEEALCLFERPKAEVMSHLDRYWKELGKWERKGIEDLKFFLDKNGTVTTWRTCAEGETIIQT